MKPRQTVLTLGGEFCALGLVGSGARNEEVLNFEFFLGIEAASRFILILGAKLLSCLVEASAALVYMAGGVHVPGPGTYSCSLLSILALPLMLGWMVDLVVGML